jgi:hypothetical protein
VTQLIRLRAAIDKSCREGGTWQATRAIRSGDFDQLLTDLRAADPARHVDSAVGSASTRGTTEVAPDGDGATLDWSAGVVPAPVRAEEPRGHAFTEEEAILDAPDVDADALLDREWTGAGEPPAIRADRHVETKPEDVATTRGATPAEQAERVRPVGMPRVFLG